MSTHTWYCIVCGEPTYCMNDAHALGCGDSSCCDAQGLRPLVIEFCSLACFEDLQRRMVERRRIYDENRRAWEWVTNHGPSLMQALATHQATGAADRGHCVPLCRAAHQALFAAEYVKEFEPCP